MSEEYRKLTPEELSEIAGEELPERAAMSLINANLAIPVNAAVAAFTKCLADLGKDDHVQVNCIHPSLVETERQWKRIRAEVERTGEPEDKVRERFCRAIGLMRYGTVEDVADLVTFIVSSRATWLHGATIDLDGGEIPVL